MSMAMKVARAGPGRAMPGTGYRGDPGLFGFLGNVGKTLGRAALGGLSGLASGGPLGIAGGVVRAFQPKGVKPIRLSGPMGFGGQPFQMPRGAPVPGVVGRIQRALPGGATGFQTNGGPPGPGYRLNKSDYFVKANPMDPNSPGVFVPEGTRWVKIRHRNPLNPRALSKAIGRVGSAKKATTMLGRITIRKAC